MTPHDCRSWAELNRLPAANPTPTAPTMLLSGWQTDDERERLFQIAKGMQLGQRFLEIGVYGGTTLSIFALMAPGAEIYGMDSWENETPSTSPIDGRMIDVKTLCLEQLHINGVSDRVTLIDGSSHFHGPQWKLPLDVLLIDGDHSEEGAWMDLRDFAPHVVAGGLLLMDDFSAMDQVRAATERWLRAEPAGRWEEVHRYADANVGKMLTLRRTGP